MADDSQSFESDTGSVRRARRLVRVVVQVVGDGGAADVAEVLAAELATPVAR